ncbi:MAG: hypothetical protein M3Y65_10560 [Pseudomonadota bacterium]|nr:hypothetical protein [Pseudomonadota bacterium]
MTRAQYQVTLPRPPRSSAMQPLFDLIGAGLQPLRREVWLGLGFCPPKRCAIAIDPFALPGNQDCRAVAGLDVLLCYHGHSTRYGVLRDLCASLLQAGPRRLLVIDLDYGRLAFLKLWSGA